MVGPGGELAAAPRLLVLVFLCFLAGGARPSPATDALRRVSPRAAAGGLCQQLLLPQGYPCTEHTVQTDDGFLLSLQHIPHGKNGIADNAGPPVFLQHGLFQGGDTWFINSNEQSLGYILADNGFDVWIGNVRGTRWSKGHSTLSVHDKVHRLDRDCSGVLVLGRTQLSTSIMHAIFREKTADALGDGTQQVLQRKYVALVIGRPRHPKGLLSAPLAKVVLQDGRSERLTVCAGSNTASVQDALTEYCVIESCPQGYTWLELFPRTGRKHQLRVHCAEVLGTPIIGDYKFGRQAHQNWTPLPMPQTIDEEILKKRKLPFGLALGGGSVAEQQPQLHLHCKQMILPDISAAMQQLQSSHADHDFSDLEKLSFVAPMPLHMRLSWKILMSIGK